MLRLLELRRGKRENAPRPGRAVRTLALLWLVACADVAGPPDYYEIDLAFLISDAAHHAGVYGFYFLPPMVENPGPFDGEFDGTLAPEVALYAGATCEGAPVRRFDADGSASEAVTVDAAGEAYAALWITKGARLATAGEPDYRICVTVGAALLGWADVDVVADRRQLRGVAADNVGLTMDAPLLIKFRIERGVTGGVEEAVAPSAADDAPEHTAGTPLTITAGAGGLLDNDDRGAPSAVLFSFGGGGLGGDVTDHPSGATVAPLPGHADGALTVNADGSFTFVPPAQHAGPFAFSYRLANTAGISDATVTVTEAVPALVATDDVYPATVIGNVASRSADVGPAGFSVLANDVVPGAATITDYDAGTANGGSVTMVMSGTGAGEFVYDPPRGFEGEDRFSYTLTDGGITATATVTLSVNGVIWFVDNSAGACAADCDGRRTHPYPTLAAFAAANDGIGQNPGDGDAIFLFESETPYAGPLVLRSGQKLIGQDATVALDVAAALAPAAGAMLPAMAPSNDTHASIEGAAGVLLGADNMVRGLRIDATAGAALSGNGVGALMIADVTRLSAAGGPALDIQFATGLAATIGSLVSTGSTSHGVRIGGIVGGALDVTGAVTVTGSAGPGVRLFDNVAGMAFGRLDIAPAAGQQALHVSDHAGSVAVGAGAIIASGATAVEVSAASGTTPLAIVLTSVSADGGAHGIRLRGTSGAFEVRGDGASDAAVIVGQRGRTTSGSGGSVLALGSGGTIRNTSGDAISVENAAGVILRNIVIGDAAAAVGEPADGTTAVAGDGVDLLNASGVTLDNVRIARTGGHAVRGAAVSGLEILNSELLNAGDVAGEDAIALTEPRGAAVVSNSILDGMYGRGVSLRVDGKTSSVAPDALSLVNVAVSNGHASGGGGVLFDSQGSSHFLLRIVDSRVEQVAGEGITVLSQGSNASDRSRAHLEVRRTGIAGVTTAIRVQPSRQGSATFDIGENDAGNGGGFTGLSGAGIVLRNDSNGELAGVLDSNAVSSVAEPLSTVANGSAGGLMVTGTTRVRVTNNTFVSSGAHGMSFITQNGNISLHALIGGNTATAGGGFFAFQNGIYIETRSGIGCFNLSTADGAGNNVATGSGPGVAEGIFLLGAGGTPRLHGLASGGDSAARTLLNANNASNASADVFTGDVITGGTCSVP